MTGMLYMLSDCESASDSDLSDRDVYWLMGRAGFSADHRRYDTAESIQFA